MRIEIGRMHTSIHRYTSFLREVKGRFISGSRWKGPFACMCHEEVVSVFLSFCPSLSFFFVSWLSARDNVHIYSLREGKTIVPGGFPSLYLYKTKPPLTVTSPHTASCCLVPLEKGRRGNSELINGPWVVFLRLQPPTMASPPTGCLEFMWFSCR